MPIGQDYYADQPYRDFENLSRLQSGQALQYGDIAARYADPFQKEREKYQRRLSDLIATPGAIESSPFYRYLAETQMNAVRASNAAQGLTRSGRGLMALQDRAAGVASQSYFPQAELLALLAGARTSSPAAAGLAFARGGERSQDYAQLAQAARGLGRYQRPGAETAYDPMSGHAARLAMFNDPYFTRSNAPALNRGGQYGLPYAEDFYTPSSGAGTGYVSSDYGTTRFDRGLSSYLPSGGEDWSAFYDYPEYYEEEY